MLILLFLSTKVYNDQTQVGQPTCKLLSHVIDWIPAHELLLCLLYSLKKQLAPVVTCVVMHGCFFCHGCIHVLFDFTVPMSRKGQQEEQRAPAQGPPCLPCSSITPPNQPRPDGPMLVTWTQVPPPSHFPATVTPWTPGDTALKSYHWEFWILCWFLLTNAS